MSFNVIAALRGENIAPTTKASIVIANFFIFIIVLFYFAVQHCPRLTHPAGCGGTRATGSTHFLQK